MIRDPDVHSTKSEERIFSEIRRIVSFLLQESSNLPEFLAT